jgi:hypothetical protein
LAQCGHDGHDLVRRRLAAHDDGARLGDLATHVGGTPWRLSEKCRALPTSTA